MKYFLMQYVHHWYERQEQKGAEVGTLRYTPEV